MIVSKREVREPEHPFRPRSMGFDQIHPLGPLVEQGAEPKLRDAASIG